MIECPLCKCTDQTTKVISFWMPMKFCNSCTLLWGEPFVTIFTYIFAPMEGAANGHFTFYQYQGNYFKGLWGWMNESGEEDE